MLDRPETLRTVESDGCPFCDYVHGNCAPVAGVAFVVDVDSTATRNVQRVERLTVEGDGPPYAYLYLCKPVTESAARAEIAAAARRAQKGAK